MALTLVPLRQTADQLLARADAAKALAEEAAKKGQSTFREAESILEDLRGVCQRHRNRQTDHRLCRQTCFQCVNKCVYLFVTSDFDKRVNDNKTAAEEAMKKIPIINATITAAREKTQQAEEALGNAAADARDAKQKAEEAERIASSVQKVRRFSHQREAAAPERSGPA